MLDYTEDFKKVLIGVFIACFFLMVYSVLLTSVGMSGYSFSEVNSIERILLNQIESLLTIGIFWFGVAYLTKEKQAALIAFSIKLMHFGYISFQYLSNEINEELYMSFYWHGRIIPILGYMVFGLFVFKNIRGLYMGIAFFLMFGLWLASPYGAYESMINPLLHVIGLGDILEFRVGIGENRHTTINIFYIFSTRIRLLIEIIVFWFVFSGIRQYGKFDLSFRTIKVFPKLDVISFSIVYLALGTALVKSIFGSRHYFDMTMTLNQEVNVISILQLFAFCFAIFIIASLYRNCISSYFSSKGSYPSWLYFFLNIPIINVFAWIILVLRSPSQDASGGNDISAALTQIKKVQKGFTMDNKNKGIKGLLFLFILGSFFSKFSQIANSGLDVEAVFAVLFIPLISIGLILWYFNDKNAVFFLFGIQSIIILLVGIFLLDFGMDATVIAGLVNVIVYYPLFHFDGLKFVDSDDNPLSESDMHLEGRSI